MATHDAWSLVCRLFTLGTPVLRSMLLPREMDVLPALGRAVKPTTLDQGFVLCPYCQQQRGQLWSDGHGGRNCHCPECGPVAVTADDIAAVALDEDWLRQKLRITLEIESRDGIDPITEGVWRLGDSRRSPVVLARNLMLLWREPALLERVRVAAGALRVITPRSQQMRGVPFGPGVQWLALEERFAFYGGGIVFLQDGGEQEQLPASDAQPVNGPFSEDFRWITLPQWPHGAIHCTDGQVAVFEALWHFKGEPMTAKRIMHRAGLDSKKPIDVFKVERHNKGNPQYEGPLFAYRTLVETKQREGLYSMSCAKV